MISTLRSVLSLRPQVGPLADPSPVREELFGLERLEQHARSLAEAQTVTRQPRRVPSLHARLENNAKVLLAAYRTSAREMESGRGTVPAEEWLLDNYHLVEEQVDEARHDLPVKFYRQLPKLESGPFAGYPRVFGIAWAYVAHTDSHFDPDILRRFLVAYQSVQPLTIGELWAVAITLRIVMIENLRRLADQISVGRDERAEAEALADQLAASGNARAALDARISARADGGIPEIFAAQLAKRLRDLDPIRTPALAWLEERLAQQNVSVDLVVQHSHQRQAASNVTVRNIITSMRLMSAIGWADLFEQVSLVDARLREGSAFAEMDFPSRNLYRSAIEQLGRHSPYSEIEVAVRALAAGRDAQTRAADEVEARRVGDPGYHLLGPGRPAFEDALSFVPPARLRLKRFSVGRGLGGYVLSILLVTALLLALAWWSLGTGATAVLVGFLVLAFLPFTEVATALVNRLVASHVEAVPLLGLELLNGVPDSLRTLVVIPTLLTSHADLREQIERLEVHYLSGAGGEVYFALLTDWADSDTETRDDDLRLLELAIDEVATLNERHEAGRAGARFHLAHRRSVWSNGEQQWMGWERKRGKLQELNRLLRGFTDTTYLLEAPGISRVRELSRLPAGVRYVITLDGDTRLPRDSAIRLIGKMAHPINQPRFDPRSQRVVDGYAILQPRVTPSLPMGRDGSIYQSVFAGPSGLDPYSAAVSNVYQDLLGEGSFTGKGIYEVDAFEAALAGRVPDNALLSHDLFEGVFARAGLASDVEVIDEFPSRYDVDAKRLHRWIRGDWQLAPWIFGHVKGPLATPAVGRWKMLDNLRRSLIAPSLLAGFGLCTALPPAASRLATLLLLASLAVPMLIAPLYSFLARPPRVSLRNHLARSWSDVKLAFAQLALTLSLLPDRAWRALDAVLRTLVRMLVTRRHLLEWTTAAQSARSQRLDVVGSYRTMAGGTALVAIGAIGALAWHPLSWPFVVPLAAWWLASPLVAMWVSRPLVVGPAGTLSLDEARELRLIARKTWRFFETFVTPDDNMLPPDNFQEVPKPVVARRTSPTNIGLYFLSTIAAREFGWTGTGAAVERIEATLATMRKLQKFSGHFFNWYGTEDLRALEPPYVSAVDSGNLAGHLIVLANACESWRRDVVCGRARAGIDDALSMLREAAGSFVPTADGLADKIASAIADVARRLTNEESLEAIDGAVARLAMLVERSAVGAEAVEDEADCGSTDLVFWTSALQRAVREHATDRALAGDTLIALEARLTAIAREARSLALLMDFAFLLDPERKLLSIGYSLTDNRLDLNCYDLLASEARLASLFAIAKGDAPTKHWFRLGRSATPIGNESALVSWSGSMFEYLMPSLVMRAPFGSLLEQTNRLVVARQQAYGASLDIPWGVSESAYNARDIDFTYQYSNFGVPGLGFKRGLGDNVVIAPYATGLATMVDPRGALANFRRIARLGGSGRYGFHDALDFTRSRLPEGQSCAVVRNFMAHHEGMTIVAIANTLQDGRMRVLFHREPMIVASELLLQERSPRDVADEPSQAEELRRPDAAVAPESSSQRVVPALTGGAPVTHLLSNGQYAVMLTSSGSGYSRWRDLAVTRWREDPTRDADGSFIFLRDVQNDQVWSPTTQPFGVNVPNAEAVFGEDHATFTRRDGSLRTTMEIVVSAEDDAEVRRISLTNSGRRPREIELTSYAELVLTTPATDNAHPAFAKMFVQTRHLPTFDALLATRRKRTPTEPDVWAAHFAVIEGERTESSQYETDRLRFLGRGRHPGTAIAMSDGRRLSNTVGTVLDPIFSLRHRVKVPPGGLVRVAFWTVIASSEEELMDLVDRHHDRSAFDRARTFAWTQAQVALRHVGIQAEESSDFQRLAAPLLYADARFRMPSETIRRGMGPQSNLWSQSISGDLPIVVLRIDDIDDIAQVRQLLRAHEYWRMKRLDVDLVIINERAASYVQDLQIAIETAQRGSLARPSLSDANTRTSARGSVYALRADLMPPEAQALLLAVARVVLIARRGPLSQQLAQLPRSSALLTRTRRAEAPPALPPVRLPGSHPVIAELELFNGFGGFAKGGREYVVLLDGARMTPAPWVNVIANAGFGFTTSADGSGFTWAENSRDNQLTPWSNDPVSDPTGEALYVRDEGAGDVWTATALPIRDGGSYIARHGHGYSRFEHESNEIALDQLQYVPVDDPIKITRIKLRNRSARTRRLSVTSYVEWVLGTSRGSSTPALTTEIDAATGAIFVRNAWGTAFPGRVAFADLGGLQSSWTTDRTEFLGRNGRASAPAALSGKAALSGTVGAGMDICTALQTLVELAPGASVEVVAFIGQCASDADARALIERYRSLDLDRVLADATGRWDKLLGTVQVTTPNRAMDILLNGWLLYQTTACRILARSAFYQASGAYGFRDQLQDGMALTFAMPEQTRQHLLRSAGRQFVEGDVQHWWLPHSGQGVRTHISDDRVWLAYAAATYVATSGDTAVLDEPVFWLEGPALKPGEHDAFFKPMQTDESATLFEHCARGLDQCIALTGEHGLPLMGTGDWNDGMNRVGQDGRGESVWLAWLLLRTIDLFGPLAERRDAGRLARWRAHAVRVREAIERDAWDGEWYRRATFDDGTWMGSHDSDECRIDSIAQSWAVLSGLDDQAHAARAATAIASVDQHLIRQDDALALLFTPPFDTTHHDPGYIKGYPPGLRENGGQYSHAAMWLIFAFAKLGDMDKAVEVFSLLNPINHALTRSAADIYKVEPYVVAADVYSVAPHAGRGGWTWYTGSAAWMYRAGIEGILGITREGDAVVFAPRLPSDWPGFEVTIEVEGSRYAITVARQRREAEAAMNATLDEEVLTASDGRYRLPLDGERHVVHVLV